MKLATFKAANELERTGIVVGDGIIEITDIAPTMIDLIANWASSRNQSPPRRRRRHALQAEDVQLCAPVPRPQKVMAIGLNYADHIAESGAQTPENRYGSPSSATPSTAPRSDPGPQGLQGIDWKPRWSSSSASAAATCRRTRTRVIFGYACGNDISVRDWQFHTPQCWSASRSTPTPHRPWIVTATRSAIRTRWHPLPRQRQNDAGLEHEESRVQLLRPDRLSQPGDELEPGDMVFTGTPAASASR